MTEVINKSLIETKWLRNQPNQEKKNEHQFKQFRPFFIYLKKPTQPWIHFLNL